jgi:hypothetical protein
MQYLAKFVFHSGREEVIKIQEGSPELLHDGIFFDRIDSKQLSPILTVLMYRQTERP